MRSPAPQPVAFVPPPPPAGPLHLFDLAIADVVCPFRHAGAAPVLCEVDCAAWRGQHDGLGYCALICGERGPICA